MQTEVAEMFSCAGIGRLACIYSKASVEFGVRQGETD